VEDTVTYETIEHVNGHKPASTYEVRLLTKHDPLDWAILPHALQSVRDFCAQYEPEADAGRLVQVIQQAFILDDPGMIVLAFFKDDTLIGHMLCDRTLHYFAPIVTVHQYLLTAAISRDCREQAIALVKAWGKQPWGTPPQPCQSIQWLVRSKELAVMYRRYFQATTHRLIMRTTIEG